ncbi:hypothetical protein [Streptococcus halotolerans]|uniref:hypothetical protein n=1 Tax=Streptococcus halotolerans TaxID=1814128 RepID=UPI000787D6AB|nr:hypothetical protein [Streptococcus halotolerans]
MKRFLKLNGLFLLACSYLTILLLRLLTKPSVEKGDLFLTVVCLLGLVSGVWTMYRRTAMRKNNKEN